MKILATSDWRLNGEARKSRSVREILAFAQKYEPDLILHAGNVWDSPSPTSSAYDHGVTLLRDFGYVAPMIVICGFLEGGESPAWKWLQHRHMVRTATTLQIDDVTIFAVPHLLLKELYTPVLDAQTVIKVTKSLDSLCQIVPRGMKGMKILLAHGSLPYFDVSEEMMSPFMWCRSWCDAFDLSVVGGTCIPQQIGNVCIPGSPNWGNCQLDGEVRGFYTYADGFWQRHLLNPQPASATTAVEELYSR